MKSVVYWDCWQDSLHSASMNMALDDALLQQAAERYKPLLRFYAWDQPAVSIGYVQTIAAAPAGYAVVRRPTGGGVVYHDHDFTYSVIIPRGHWLTGLDRTKSYAWINRSVAAGLSQAMLKTSLAKQDIPGHVDRKTMVCFQNPTRYDILLGGKKIAGSAQRRTKDGILHQGSIHFDGELPYSSEKIRELIKTGFADVLTVQFAEFTPSPDLLQLAEKLVLTQYATAAWNRRR